VGVVPHMINNYGKEEVNVVGGRTKSDKISLDQTER
jgi:hypothetical protein